MSGLLMPLLLVAGIVIFIKRCDWLGICGGGGGGITPAAAVTTPAAGATTVTPTSTPKVATTITGDKYAITAADNKLGPANCASSAHGPDLGFGFSKDGGPVAADGFTSDAGEPRVGDNRNNKSMTIALLPGPCETKPYKGKVQYRYKDLSASCESCVLAKRYYLYKYGVGGVNPIPGIGGEGVREGGKTTGKVAPPKKVGGKAKAKFVRIAI